MTDTERVPLPPSPGGYSPARQGPPPPTGLAIAARVTAVLVGLYSITAFFLAFPARHSYRVAAVKGDDAAEVFTGYHFMPLLWAALMLVSYVVTCLWLFECRTRVDGYAPHVPQRRSKVWVWLAWMVPVVSFWFPYQVVRDLRRGSFPDRQPSNALAGWWLGAWIAFTVLDSMTATRLPTEGEIDIALINATLVPIQAISTALCLAALVLWLALISSIMRGQKELGRAPTPLQQTPPPTHWPQR